MASTSTVRSILPKSARLTMPSVAEFLQGCYSCYHTNTPSFSCLCLAFHSTNSVLPVAALPTMEADVAVPGSSTVFAGSITLQSFTIKHLPETSIKSEGANTIAPEPVTFISDKVTDAQEAGSLLPEPVGYASELIMLLPKTITHAKRNYDC